MENLSGNCDAQWLVIECICSDLSMHRAGLSRRERNISGWQELVWADIEKVKGYFLSWKGND
ncbi:MAG: hypothetical protein ACM3PS_09200 [Syntrophothermus sp.]